MWKYRKKKKATSKFRSGLEVSVIENLTKRKVGFKYEKCVVHYFKPSKEHKYTPDLELDNGFGMCGKSGQTVQVGLGIPSCKILMTVGGSKV